MTPEETQMHLDKKFLDGKIKTLYYPEILEGVVAMKTHEDKILALRNNATNGLMTFLRFVFDESIVFDITPKMARDRIIKMPDLVDHDMSELTLTREWKNLYIFTEPRLTQGQKLMFLDNWWSSFHQDDIDLVLQMFSKKLKYEGITEGFIREAYPNLLGGSE